MQEVIISKNEAGQRFDKFLGKFFKEAGSGFIYKMLRKKNIELNGKKATGNEKLNVGDSVRIFMADDTIAKFRGTPVAIAMSSKNALVSSTNNINTDLKTGINGNTTASKELNIKENIIYEDENVIFVNKPAGILSQKAAPTDISINELIIDYLLETEALTEEELLTFKPSVCNRLDRNTTGIITFGKSLAGIQELSKGFKDRSFDKYYLTIVWGRLDDKKTIEGYLAKDEAKNKVTITAAPSQNDIKANVEKASFIETEYEPLKHGIIELDGKEREITLLKIKLITGKTHQIRAHLSSTGHGILGDDKYGKRNDNVHLKKQYDIKYQLLHSYELHFGKLDDEYEALKPLQDKTFIGKYDKIYDTLFK